MRKTPLHCTGVVRRRDFFLSFQGVVDHFPNSVNILVVPSRSFHALAEGGFVDDDDVLDTHPHVG